VPKALSANLKVIVRNLLLLSRKIPWANLDLCEQYIGIKRKQNTRTGKIKKSLKKP
jgi:hypothetical protein